MATYKEVKAAAKTAMGYTNCTTCGKKKIKPGEGPAECKKCNPPAAPTFNPQT